MLSSFTLALLKKMPKQSLNNKVEKKKENKISDLR